MRFILPVDPDRFEGIEATVLKAAPHAKIDRLETPLMWPQMQIEFFWRDLDNVVEAVKQALFAFTRVRSVR